MSKSNEYVKIFFLKFFFPLIDDIETGEDQSANLELPLSDLPKIANATNHFSSDNKIGEGGYGPVYRVIQGDETNNYMITKVFLICIS